MQGSKARQAMRQAAISRIVQYEMTIRQSLIQSPRRGSAFFWRRVVACFLRDWWLSVACERQASLSLMKRCQRFAITSITSTDPFLKRRQGSALIRRRDVANFCMPDGALYTSSPLGSPPAPFSDACSHEGSLFRVDLLHITCHLLVRCPSMHVMRQLAL